MVNMLLKAGTQIFFKKYALEASCRTKPIALVKSIVHDRAVARLKALEQAVWKY
jgi:tagatose-1,6-bisphosphate aldolase non-catalytic subunit AgaZ/GatZ